MRRRVAFATKHEKGPLVAGPLEEVGLEGRAPCEACGAPGDLPAFEVAVCPACSFEHASRLHVTTPLDRCPFCNP
ncbi:MAG: hypothetical protein H6722_13450 [Sandaracinus sp.]|nr:hypothetical protein [Sandaracinus sp.]MCB9613449.1 hypothetical protein [Sandaracinus sp.]MCB9621557.1 hypothetical protein [Sandaracinus sp.]